MPAECAAFCRDRYNFTFASIVKKAQFQLPGKKEVKVTPTSFDTKKVLDYLEKRNALGVRGNSTKKGSFKEGGTYEHTFVYHAPPSFEDGVVKITEVAPRPTDAELDTLCPNKDNKQDTECRKERMPYTAPGQDKQWESKNIKRAVGEF